MSSYLYSQSNGDYKSAASGNWSSTATWQKYNGSNWVPATTTPTGSENITIQEPDSVDVNIPITITGKIINLGGRLGNSTTNLTFGNNGIYEHAANGGSIPVSTWAVGSTCLLTGITANAPSNSNQNFYNFSWNCPGYGTSAINLGWSGNTIGGDVKVNGVTTKTYLRLTASNVGNQAPGNTVITINGNIIIDDTLGALTSTGSSGQDTIEIYVKGDITSSGNFNLANGSGATCKWFLSGDLIINDGLITTHSNINTLPDSLFFNGTSKQIFYKADSLGSASNIQFATMANSIVDLGITSIGGTATTFTQSSGSTLMTARPNGLQGNLSMQGLITLPSDGSYEYNGTVAQSDSLLPATVMNLTIDNPSTVTLTKPITINGVLKLKQGILDNSLHLITISTGGSVLFEGGNTTVPIPGWPNAIREISVAPREFKLFNNFPNPFNPSTIIRFSVPKDGVTSLKIMNILGQEIATLFDGYAKAGNTLEVTFDAKNITSGVYFARLQQEGKVSIMKMNLIK